MIPWVKTKLAKNALARADALRLQKLLEAAEDQYFEAIKLASEASTQGNAEAQGVEGHAHLGLGRVYLQRRNPANAVNELDAACRMLPSDWEPLYYRGCGEGSLGDYRSAENSFTASLAMNSNEARIYVQRGHARFKAGRMDEAVADYSEAQLRGSSESLLFLGATLEQQSRWDDAAAVYQQAASINETAPRASARLGIVYAKSGRFDQSTAWLERAIRQKEDPDSALFYYGWVCYQLRRFDSCLSAWERLQQRHPQHQRLGALSRKVSYLWGDECLRAGDYDRAIHQWMNYYNGREGDKQLARALAELNLRAADQAFKQDGISSLSEIEERLLDASELAPDDTRFLFYLAVVSMVSGDFESGAEYLEEALALDQDNPRLRHHLALCDCGNGDETQAEEGFQAVIGQGASDLWKDRAAKSLAALYIKQGHWSEALDTLLAVART